MENQEAAQVGEQLPPASEAESQDVVPTQESEERREESVAEEPAEAELEPGRVTEREPEQVSVAAAEEVAPEPKEEEGKGEEKQADAEPQETEAGARDGGEAENVGERESEERQEETPSEGGGTASKPEKESEPEGGDRKEEMVAEPDKSLAVAPGSMSFAFLEQEDTVAFLRSSQTLFILRGLPGSGKSLLARTILNTYKDHCVVISGDDHGVKPEKYATSAEEIKAVDGAVAEHCSSGKAVVVVDDTNHTHGRLARLGELAEENQYVALYVEPCTEWGRDVEQLTQKTRRGLSKSQIQALVCPMVETSLPFYFGWFLCPVQQEKLRNMANDFLSAVGSLEAFKEHIGDFAGEAEKDMNLQQYFQDKGVLHCTTKFCDYGKAKGAKEYAEQQAVREAYGSKSNLALTALFLTPRTLGAQVSLTEDQLRLWPEDAEKEVMPDVDLPRGSRAHVTLGCAEGVEPLKTGLDLLEVVLQNQQGNKGEHIQDLELGPLTYYSKGTWMLTLGEPLNIPAIFSSFYGPKKEEEGVKEPEKKKKHKCTVM